MKLTVLLLCALLAACANMPITATQTAQPTATITAQVTVQPERPERMVARSTATLRQCAVTADVLTVRTCAGVQCAAIDWLRQGEIVTTTQAITGWIWTGGGWINSVFCKEQK